MNSTNDSINYKQKYKNLKRKLKFLINEQECFAEELRKVQRKLLSVARDRSFLLDRLLQYEKIDESSSDSDATASSDSDGDAHVDRLFPKKRKASAFPQFPNTSDSTLLENMNYVPISDLPTSTSANTSSSVITPPPRKRPRKDGRKTTKATDKTSNNESVASNNSLFGQLTKEEIERHLDAKQTSFIIERAPATMPSDIFNNENSNFGSEDIEDNRTNGSGDADGLPIDLQK